MVDHRVTRPAVSHRLNDMTARTRPAGFHEQPTAVFERWLLLTSDGRQMLVPDEGLVLGRHEQGDGAVQGRGVSRRHVRLRPVPNGLEVSDLGSTNGTRIDGRRIDGPCVVGEGRVLSVGDARFFIAHIQPDERTRVV